ncbi:hypothetical protein PIB30_043489 [Stylosanthes scabra]|uniref:Reverse transcriptase zinc-binding domain-containing protein n=1 Tax=Stylosanthes scabra TaxID=79078 RepID=A0ABU6QEY3_9FABA|nr:hypothetical protein [Stylosanthes scabra]
MNLESNTTVNELILPDERSWNVNLIRELFLPFEAQQIIEIPIPRTDQVDTLIWKKARDGVFKVKLAYHEIKAENQYQSRQPNTERIEEGMNGSPVCIRCWKDEEYEKHVLRDCEFAKKLWFGSPFNLRTENAVGERLESWIFGMLRQMQEKEKSLFGFLLNQLWRARNLLVFEGVSKPIDEELLRAMGA